MRIERCVLDGGNDHRMVASVMNIEKIVRENNLWIRTNGEQGKRADLSNMDLSEENLRGKNFHKARLIKADLSETDLQEANLQGADIRWSRLYKTKFTRATLSEANFRGVDAIGADFRGTQLIGANFYRADLGKANFCDADLEQADFREANLQNANLDRANICYVAGDGNTIKSFLIHPYYIVIAKDIMAIGCKQYSIEEWMGFSEYRISKMDKGALKFWKKWKPILVDILKDGT